MTIPSNPTIGSMVGYFPLESVAGLITADMVQAGPPTFASGLLGNCVDFGTVVAHSKYIQYNAGNLTDLGGSSNWATSFWVKIRTEPATGETARLLDWRSTTGTASYVILDYKNVGGTKRLNFNVGGTNTDYDITLGTSSWYHFVLVGKTASTYLYMNNSLIITQGRTSGGSSVVRYCLGNAYDAVSAYGAAAYIDDAVVFSRDLSLEEIEWLYNNGSGRNYGDYVGITSGVSDSYTKYLLHFLGQTNGKAILDENEHFWYTGGSSILTNSYHRYRQTAGLYFNGASDYVYTPHDTDLEFGTGDLTIDFWFRPYALPSSGNLFTLFSDYDGATDLMAMYIWNDAGTHKIRLRHYSADDIYTNQSIGYSLVTNAWYHFALVRSGSDWKIFINGSQIGSTYTNATTWPTQSGNFYLGYDGTGNYANAHMSEFRISKGIARWTSNFTPQVYPYLQSSELDDANTVSLVSFDQLNITLEPYDASGKLWRPGGNARIYDSVWRMPSKDRLLYGTAYFDGTGDYFVSEFDYSDFYNFGDLFTVEAWVNFSSLANNNTYAIWSYTTGGSQRRHIYVNVDGSGVKKIGYYDYYASAYQILLITDPVTLQTGRWYHIAVVYDSGTPHIFLNGTEVSLGTSTTGSSGTYSGGSSFIGASDASTYFFHGYIDQLRISKVARWTASFDYQTYPYGGDDPGLDTYTKSLIHGIGNGNSRVPYDSAGLLWTFSGGATISQGARKFGTGALYNNTATSGFYLTGWQNSYASNPFTIGANDFTVDFWIFPISVSGSQMLFDCRPGADGLYPMLYLSGTTLYYYVNSAPRITATTVFATNTWYHIALARSGTNTKLFVNGTQEGSTYSDTNSYGIGTSRPIIMTDGFAGGSIFHGYLEEFRYSLGIARWTSNFTPPTGEYPSGGASLRRFRAISVGV